MEFNPAYRHRVTIQRRTSTRNSVGEVLYSWEDQATVWAEIHDDIITIRYLRELELGWRVVIGRHHFYEITGIVDRKFRGGRLVDLSVKEIQTQHRAGAAFPCASMVNSQALRLPSDQMANTSNKEISDGNTGIG